MGNTPQLMRACSTGWGFNGVVWALMSVRRSRLRWGLSWDGR